MPAKLRHGNVGAMGGARKGAGRKPDEFKAWISTLVHSPSSRERLMKILIDANDAETKITDQGVEVPTRARADTYLKALELAWHYAEGKPVDRISMRIMNPNDPVQSVINADASFKILRELEENANSLSA